MAKMIETRKAEEAMNLVDGIIKQINRGQDLNLVKPNVLFRIQNPKIYLFIYSFGIQFYKIWFN